ncbi:MAG: 50S ribosomal protein L10 [Candidatus Hydrothermarchaeaceae archaeon]
MPVAKWKHDEVDKLASLLLDYPVIGIVNTERLPAKHLQKIRTLLRGNALIKVSKKSLMKHAIEKASKEEKSLGGLAEHMRGQPAFIFSKINPFKLYKILEKNRSMVPAKPNSVATKDIAVQEGETSFPPGPVLGELQQAGIPTGVQNGKIVIKEDKVIVKEGEKINPIVAAALAKLDIAPVEIGIDLVAAHEGNTIFSSDVLVVDEAKTISDLQNAHTCAVALSIASGYITKETANMVLANAFNEARNLALAANILEPEVIKEIILKAHLQMLSLKSALDNAETNRR